jgi:ABC-type glycerol-3-phosphate transport system permease component
MRSQAGTAGRLGGLARVGLGWLLGLVMVAPFLYMLATALTGAEESLDHAPLVGPSRVHPETFRAALAVLPFGRLILNSLIFSVAVVAGQVFTSTTAAYAFARLRFAGRDRLFLGYLSVLMLPAGLLLVPRFLLISALGWVDTYPGLVSGELVSVAGIFLLRQFFVTLPRELEDAARLEGAGEWTIFRRIVLPQSRPALVTFAVLALAAQWRSFLWPLVATRSADMRVLEVGIASLHGVYDLNWPYQMAVATAAVIPLVVLYFVAQRYVTRALELGATAGTAWPPSAPRPERPLSAGQAGRRA